MANTVAELGDWHWKTPELLQTAVKKLTETFEEYPERDNKANEIAKLLFRTAKDKDDYAKEVDEWIHRIKEGGKSIYMDENEPSSTYKIKDWRAVPSNKSDSKSTAKGAGTTFNVHNVIPNKRRLKPGSAPYDIILERCGSVSPEAYSELKYTPFEHAGSYKPLCNAFIAAVHTAFCSHYPLVFTPDAIWLCILQGLSFHINTHAEKLRHQFVEFESQKDISVYPSTVFVKGSPDNPWSEVFDLFSEGIQGHIGQKLHDLLTPTFSTTGPVERAASQIVLMDCFKQYFRYQMVCICGIPSITLEGTVDDWTRLRERALALKQFNLEWWIKELLPVLDQFIDAASGKVDKYFWMSIYKLEKAYGAELINGWILTLFPYFGIGKRNGSLDAWRFETCSTSKKKKNSFGFFTYDDEDDDNDSGVRFDWTNENFSWKNQWMRSPSVTTSSFASAVVSVPFDWVSVPEKATYPMQFFAGFMAATQDPDTLAIHPEIGWAVADRENIDKADEAKKKHDSSGWW